MPFLHSCTRAAAASPASHFCWGLWGWGGRHLGLSAIATTRNVLFIYLGACGTPLFGFLLNKVGLKAEGEGW